MDNIFTYDVVYDSQELIDTEWVTVSTTKTARFRELDKRDKNQHKLHFMLVAIFKSGENVNELKVDYDQLYDITVRAVNILLLVDSGVDSIHGAGSFTEQDKQEFLSDSGALISFGSWFLREKIAPFFPKLITQSKK